MLYIPKHFLAFWTRGAARHAAGFLANNSGHGFWQRLWHGLWIDCRVGALDFTSKRVNTAITALTALFHYGHDGEMPRSFNSSICMAWRGGEGPFAILMTGESFGFDRLGNPLAGAFMHWRSGRHHRPYGLCAGQQGTSIMVGTRVDGSDFSGACAESSHRKKPSGRHFLWPPGHAGGS